MKKILNSNLAKIGMVITIAIALMLGVSTVSVAQSEGGGIEISLSFNQVKELLGILLPQPVEDVVLGAFGSPDVYTEVFLHNGVTIGNLPFATTTDTGTSATLVAGDLINIGYHVVTFGGALGSSFTYTLPASTTLSNFVPFVGDKKEVCWFLAASSTAITGDLIFAAGTGIDFVVSTTSAIAVLGVGYGNTACIDFQRQATGNFGPGDITAQLFLTDEAD